MDFTGITSGLWYSKGEEKNANTGVASSEKAPPSFLGTLFGDVGLSNSTSRDASQEQAADPRSFDRSQQDTTRSSTRAGPFTSDQRRSDDRTCRSKDNTRKVKSDDLQRREDGYSARSSPGRSVRINRQRSAGWVASSSERSPSPRTPPLEKRVASFTPQTQESSQCSSQSSDTGSDEVDPYGTIEAVRENLKDGMREKEDETATPLKGYHEDRMIFSVTSSQSALSKKLPDFSLRPTEREALLREKRNLSKCPFGRFYTAAAVFFALAGIALSVYAQQSLSFVKVQKPFELSPQMNKVEYVGLVHTRLCYNDTAIQGDRRLLSLSDVSDVGSQQMPVSSTESTYTASTAVNHHNQTGCFTLNLTTELVDDLMWNVSRLFLSLAIAFGSFLTIMLICSTFWETINLKPIAMAMLVTYFFQSLSFFFFDSDLCREHFCRLSEGSISSIVASLFWFLSGLCIIRMDVLYQAEQSRWARRRKRAIKKLKLQRKFSSNTTATTNSDPASSSPSSPASPEARNLTFLFDEEAQEVVDFRSWIGMSEDSGDDVYLGASTEEEIGASYEV